MLRTVKFLLVVPYQDLKDTPLSVCEDQGE